MLRCVAGLCGLPSSHSASRVGRTRPRSSTTGSCRVSLKSSTVRDGGGHGLRDAEPVGHYPLRLATNAKGAAHLADRGLPAQPHERHGTGLVDVSLQGNTRALLVDTAQNTVDAPASRHLKAVVRHLLGTNDDGSTKATAVDFVVRTPTATATTGKNGLMNDRTTTTRISTGAQRTVQLRADQGAAAVRPPRSSGMAASEIDPVGERSSRSTSTRTRPDRPGTSIARTR